MDKQQVIPFMFLSTHNISPHLVLFCLTWKGEVPQDQFYTGTQEIFICFLWTTLPYCFVNSNDLPLTFPCIHMACLGISLWYLLEIPWRKEMPYAFQALVLSNLINECFIRFSYLCLMGHHEANNMSHFIKWQYTIVVGRVPLGRTIEVHESFVAILFKVRTRMT